MLLRKKRSLVVAAVLAVLTGGGLWLLLRQTPSSVAKTASVELSDGNSDAVWSLVPKAEAEEMNMDAGTFRRLIHDYVYPTFRSFGNPIARSMEMERGLPDGWRSTYTYRRPDGMEVSFRASAIPSREGPRLHNLLSHLVMETMLARHKLPADKYTYDWEIRGIQADAPLLDSLGVHGIVAEEAGQRYFVTWAERLQVAEQKLGVLRSRQPR